VPVDRGSDPVEGSGNFLAGLVNAGVPVDVLWGPIRYVSTVGHGNTATDFAELNGLLWLPTQFEMIGASQQTNPEIEGTEPMLAENETNQARLEYYMCFYPENINSKYVPNVSCRSMGSCSPLGGLGCNPWPPGGHRNCARGRKSRLKALRICF
jgi:hypothetical protein